MALDWDATHFSPLLSCCVDARRAAGYDGSDFVAALLHGLINELNVFTVSAPGDDDLHPSSARLRALYSLKTSLAFS